MMRSLVFVSIMMSVILVLDLYVYQGVKWFTGDWSENSKKWIQIVYWGLTLLFVITFVVAFFVNFEKWNRVIRLVLVSIVSISVFTKLFFFIFLFIDDLQRGVRWVAQSIGALFQSTPKEAVITEAVPSISRSEFLMKAGLVAASVPAIGMTWGIISGAHDYRVRRIKLALPNLPKAFHGIKIAQLSDIHAGSFYNKTAVKGGVEMLNKEKADVVFFTGDLVNNIASELKGYVEVFDKIKAPLGIYSVLGNHDYGDYYPFDSTQAKRKNLQDLIATEKQMGWDVLINEHRMLKLGNEQIAILGVENWGARGRFPKYGKLDLAWKGTEDAPVKILLSHDPSHWNAQVRPQYGDIDLTLSGHTHGMQFGVDSQVIKWSPVQYMYEQWAGLYSETNQHLYVNRGFGYIGFPGRIGILPEITIIELEKA